MLCARQTKSLWLRLVVLTLVVLLAIASWVAGSESWRKPIPPPNPAGPNGSAVDVSSPVDLGTYRAQFRRLAPGLILHRDADHVRLPGMVGPLCEELLPPRD
jgi:hypothetical protein